MKRNLLFLLLIIFHQPILAQWCVPNTALPYNSSMPGITRFVLNTIDRTSTDLENFPNNSYVNTGLSTELTPGQTYSVSISYTIDATICPDMNLRIWIDYNQDYQLDDVGETALSVNNQPPGTYTGSFTVPATATPGTTRMRVTAKMTPNGGHIIPTPCDVPADPFGYHGEFEDYDVVIASSTGINSPTHDASFKSFLQNNSIRFELITTEQSNFGIQVLDVNGKLINEVLSKQLILPGTYSYELNISELNLASGTYFAILANDKKRKTIPVVIP